MTASPFETPPHTTASEHAHEHGRRSPREKLAITVLCLIIASLLAKIYRDVQRWAAEASAGQQRARRYSGITIQRDGKTLLWARGDPDKNAEWFDVTDSAIDPTDFAHGIGKDSIAAIDDPEFADLGDPRLRGAGVNDDSLVIGYATDGEAKAYPLHILVRHELVNDIVGRKPVTVGY